MGAVPMRATVPYYAEALRYWDEFTQQCRRHVKSINAAVSDGQETERTGISWRPGSFSVAMVREEYPSTEINLRLGFEQWGPAIIGSVRGYQEEDLRFYPEEFEFSIGCDADEDPVAITSEGRSLSPHEFAKYVAQQFRRCYPGISLPCPDAPLE